MALRVRSGGHVDADDVKNGVRILWRAKMIADLAPQQDAAKVFEDMLRCLDRSGSQSIAIRNAAMQHTSYALHVAVSPDTRTVEAAIAATYCTSHVASLPNTLTIVLHRKVDDQAVAAPITLEMPNQALSSPLLANTQYKLTGFVADTCTEKNVLDHAHMLTYQRV
jgi:hypothetical protein